MMNLYLLLPLLIGESLAKVVTVRRTSTQAGQTLTTTLVPSAEIIQATTTTDVTIFTAVTTPLTIATGTVITTIGTSRSQPVTQESTYSQVSFSASIDPSTYTTGLSYITGTSAQPTATSASTANSATAESSQTKTTSPDSGSSVTSSTSSSAVSTSSSASSSAISTSSSTSSSIISTSSSTSSSTTPASTSTSGSSSGGYYASNDKLFSAIDTSEPLSMFSRKAITCDVPENVKVTGPIQTNKFYENFLLGGQNLTVFAQPYGIFWSTEDVYYGFGVSYTNSSQRVFGSGSPAEFYTNPLMLKSFVFSAEEMTSSNMDFSVTESSAFSTTAEISVSGSGTLKLPVAIGMGLVTGVYSGSLTPKLFTQLGVNFVSKASGPREGIQKYKAQLFNGVQWNIYVATEDSDFELKVNDDYNIVGSKAVDGLVLQVAVLPEDDTDDYYIDQAAGAYPVGASLAGSVNGNTAIYSINYELEGTSTSGKTLLYALPHHVESFSSATSNAKVDITAYSQTKGYLTGVLSDKLEMTETLYTDLQWLPYQVGTSNSPSYSSEVLQLLATVVNEEIAEDMNGQTHSSSTYTAGKSFDKFAYILLVASEILKNDDSAKQGLANLKEALSPWLSNTQLTPFIYDTAWKGVTSSADPSEDFGAPWYNDHHFHYAYYIHTAAVIGMLDKKYGGTWAEDNKDWVNSLVRDVANPSTDDTHFPVSRMFDYFHGHSWAAGLWESGDGKNEESSSEDYNFAYAMKLWGQVINDKAMEARGDLMLAIMKRSMDNYFYFKSDNKVQPSEFIGNYVPGISYENKLHHTTFFGTNEEYIQGIHMIPITGASGLIRSKDFVKQEWDAKLSTLVEGMTSGWAGILRSNQALTDANTAYKWFASDSFQSAYLDGGASRTWYLAFSAALASMS